MKTHLSFKLEQGAIILKCTISLKYVLQNSVTPQHHIAPDKWKGENPAWSNQVLYLQPICYFKSNLKSQMVVHCEERPFRVVTLITKQPTLKQSPGAGATPPYNMTDVINWEKFTTNTNVQQAKLLCLFALFVSSVSSSEMG